MAQYVRSTYAPLKSVLQDFNFVHINLISYKMSFPSFVEFSNELVIENMVVETLYQNFKSFEKIEYIKFTFQRCS